MKLQLEGYGIGRVGFLTFPSIESKECFFADIFFSGKIVTSGVSKTVCRSNLGSLSISVNDITTACQVQYVLVRGSYIKTSLS